MPQNLDKATRTFKEIWPNVLATNQEKTKLLFNYNIDFSWVKDCSIITSDIILNLYFSILTNKKTDFPDFVLVSGEQVTYVSPNKWCNV